MALKREVSKSVADLQHNVKRLALSEDSLSEKPVESVYTREQSSTQQTQSDRLKTPQSEEASSMYSIDSTVNMTEDEGADKSSESSLRSVLSSSRSGFEESYVKMEEIGRGGFSVVYKCRSLQTNEIFAVKVIDLRPLKLHSRFNPTRLRREVDIMRRLRHPNIIQFVEVFEDEEQLQVVMELCPGDELFDVILARKFFSEEDARPIFQQLCSSLSYLHSLDIIHRDIKPENVLYMHKRDPVTGLPIIKLLDFGLSKHAGMGSEAKTFVGTPCYLAPEVELTAKGNGGTYGPPVDCWSLGAVLYVMLVARFPEFHKFDNGGMELKLPMALWGNKSDEAKDIVKGLMCFDPKKRLTASKALAHPWLGEFAINPTAHPSTNVDHISHSQLPPAPGYSTPSSQRHHSPSPVLTGAHRKGGSDVLDMVLHPHHNANIQDQLSANKDRLYSPSTHVNLPHPHIPYTPDNYALTTTNVNSHVSSLNLSSLITLQKNIAICFENVHKSYFSNPALSNQVREAAVVCRAQVGESTKMLCKIEQTAVSVLNMFPDLELAIEEKEPELARVFFDMVKGWVSELVMSVSATQQANRASIGKIQSILESSSQNIKVNTTSPRITNGDVVTVSVSHLQRTLKELQEKQKSNALTSVDFVNLFSSLFDQQKYTVPFSSSHSPRSDANSGYSSDDDFVIGGNGEYHNYREPGGADEKNEMVTEENDTGMQQMTYSKPPSIDTTDNLAIVPLNRGSTTGQQQLQKALDTLQEVDTILEQLGMIWGNTEVALDMLSKKGQHAEQFVGFAHNPKLHQRFTERVSEYKNFWEGVRSMCSTCLLGIMEPQETLSRYCTPPEEVSTLSSNSSTSSSISSASSSTFQAKHQRASNPATRTFLDSTNSRYTSPSQLNADDPF